MILRMVSLCGLILTVAGVLRAADFQGVITDWKCTEAMVRNGREKTLRQDRNCSLAKNSDREHYGLITDDKKYYKFDAAGDQKAKYLLHASPDKDNLKILVQGDLDGNTIKVANMSIL